jgi:dTDP-6-deoxy-L-talose 4-dehydrogenase (NAD+)
VSILLTGATGFLGSNILDSLQNRGQKVKVISREESKSKLTQWPFVEQVILTQNLFLESEDWMCAALEGVEQIIHAAWYAEPGKYLTSDLNLECLAGSLRLARAANAAGVKKFVGIGTCAEYADSDEPKTIHTPLSPELLYPICKAACYSVLEEYFDDKLTEFAWARMFFLYGKREDARRFVPYLRSRLSIGEPAELSSGEQIRDFMNASDAAEILVNIAFGNLTGPLNVCSGNPISVRELALTIAKEYGAEHCLKFGAREPNLLDPPYIVGVPNF